MKTVITDLETLVGQGIDAFEKASIDKVYIFFRDDAQVPFSLMMKIQKLSAQIITVESELSGSDGNLPLLILAAQLSAKGEDVSVVTGQDYSALFDFLEKTGEFTLFMTYTGFDGLEASKQSAIKETDKKSAEKKPVAKESKKIDASDSAKADLPVETEKEVVVKLDEEPAMEEKSATRKRASRKSKTVKEDKNEVTEEVISDNVVEFINPPAETKAGDEKPANKKRTSKSTSSSRKESKKEKYMTKNAMPFFELSEIGKDEVSNNNEDNMITDDDKNRFLQLIKKYDEKNLELYKICFSQLCFLMKSSHNEKDCIFFIDSFLSAFEPETIKALILPHYEEFASIFRK